MYDPDHFSLPMLRPSHINVPQSAAISAKPSPLRTELDYIAYRQGPQSTISIDDNRSELLVSSDMRDFSQCFNSYASFLPTTMATVPSSLSTSMPPAGGIISQEAHLTSTNKQDCDVNLQEDDRKHEREHRKRSKNWTRSETLCLIRARSSLDVKFGRTGKKSDLWDQIGDEIQSKGFSRDAQQCKDKWEKLSASYKEVKDGLRQKDDFVFYGEMHALVSGRSKKRRRDDEDFTKGGANVSLAEDEELDLSRGFVLRGDGSQFHFGASVESLSDMHPVNVDDGVDMNSGSKYTPVIDLTAMQDLVDSYLERQRKFFANLLDEVERRAELKEMARQEREGKWRKEERQQRLRFMNSIIILTQKLLGELPVSSDFSSLADCLDNASADEQENMKEPKNWTKSEVFELIKLRAKMEGKFCMSVRKVELWEEIAKTFSAYGINRNGEQCKEKWEKLMSDFKIVLDGRMDPTRSPHFADPKPLLGEDQ
ncbi:hypothetical protein KP509_04G050200 [Ceratopteris richardii]|uniref:Myb-like domain-containing protein n=1 Tax=Ceratopteris richardii TaxID=49495 RepID=A0A8T2V4N6_CERRI|nr:hypothetical protein KP509_04G050200 [Ceratopteris richardii]